MRKRLFLITVLLFTAAANAADGLVVKPSAHSVAQTLDRMEAVLKKKGIRVFARVDHQKNAEGVGLTLRPTSVLIFGNPKMGTPLMDSAQTAGIDLPMKVLAWQDADGKVWLAYNDPAYLTGRHGITDRDAVKTKMAGALKAMTDQATAP